MSTVPRQKQLRVQGPRSSGGCQMCKQRHVKCDETRPECNRCTKKGRRCEYARPSGAQYKQHVIIYTVAQTPSPFPDVDASSQRALYHYRIEAAPSITYPFRSELWNKTVFQMSEKYSFVMSAMKALSNMYEFYQQPPSARSRLYQSSLRFYNQSIRAILKLKQDEANMDAIIVAAIIFYLLDNLRGSWPNALHHALSGLKLLEQRFKNSGYEKPSPLTMALQQQFITIPDQYLSLGGSNEAQGYDPPLYHLDSPLPSVFDSPEVAHFHFQIWYFKMMRLSKRWLGPDGQSRISSALEMEEARRGMEWAQGRIHEWGRSFDPLLQKLYSGQITDMRVAVAIGYVDSCYKTSKAAFASSPLSSTSAPSSTTPVSSMTALFTTVLDHMDVIYQNNTNEVEKTNDNFSIHMNAIAVLFRISVDGTAVESQRALRLLRSGKLAKREGPWTCYDALVLAERILAMRGRMGREGRSVQVLDIDLSGTRGCGIRYCVRGPDGLADEVFEEVTGLYPGVREHSQDYAEFEVLQGVGGG